MQSNTRVIELTQVPALQSHFLKFNPLPPLTNLFHSLAYFSLSRSRKKTNTTCNNSASLFVIPPQRVKDGPVGEDADQPVLHRDVMEEGLLGVHDKGVGDPEQLHQPPVEAQALVALKHQALIRPALTEEYGGGVVLQDWGSKVTIELIECFNKYVNNMLTNKWGFAKQAPPVCSYFISQLVASFTLLVIDGFRSLSPSVPEATVIHRTASSQDVSSDFYHAKHMEIRFGCVPLSWIGGRGG